MTARRDAILAGTTRAAELHNDLGLRQRLKGGDRPVDVIEALHLTGLVILFRPLQGLLGAYVPGADASGVLITTERNLHIQRLTAAHELGHHVMGHKAMSLDEEKDVGFLGRADAMNHDPQEIEADAFATEFMLPAWLIVSHARKHQWGKQDLARPEIAYQLSLRLGASYAATCWALANNNIVSRTVAENLARTPPKASKQRAIPDVTPENWRADVWELSEYDKGNQILGNPNDLLVLALKEHVAGGYAWDSSTLASAGLTLEKDERRGTESEGVGGAVTRRLIAHGAAVGPLRLEERRPWDAASLSLNSFELDLALIGAQPQGLPRFIPRLAA